jgi:hypothetical protein
VGTLNRLVWFGDSYLELVGIFDRDLAEAGMFGRHINVLLASSGGFAGVALATADVQADVARLRDLGSAISDPLDGERLRPDGRFVRWRTARLQVPDPDLGLAFLIEHDTSAAEWTPAERALRATQPHPLGGPVRLERLEVPVANMQRAMQRLHRDLGLAFRPSLAGGGTRDTSIGSQLLRLMPAAAQAIPTIVMSGGSEPRSADVLGIHWQLQPIKNER